MSRRYHYHHHNSQRYKDFKTQECFSIIGAVAGIILGAICGGFFGAIVGFFLLAFIGAVIGYVYTMFN